jgi:hypothetical protein
VDDWFTFTIGSDKAETTKDTEDHEGFCLEGFAFRKSFVYLRALGGPGFRIRPAPARLI